AAPEPGAATEQAQDEASGSVLVGYGTAEAKASGRRRRYQAAPAAPAAVAVAPAPPAPKPAPAAPKPAPAAPKPAPEPAGNGTTTATRARVLAKPPVRKLAKDLGVDLASVHATGPGGIVTREDVVAHAERSSVRTLTHYPDDEPWLASGVVSPDGRQTRVPVRSVRKRTAE